ncbi:MAG TPA: hypothetical protein VG841_08935 [Caulobacterales bacterium]|nr:hypothetical protein [Caulobacterales bacterium]
MRLILATGLAAVAMTSAAHAAGYSGFVGLSGTHLEANDGTLDSDATTLTGSLAFDLRGRFQTQVDAEISDVDGADDTVYGGTIHVVRRAASGWMLGGFVGAVAQGDVSTTSAGLEAAVYLHRFTIAGAAGYVDSDDVDGDGALAQVEGRFFVDRNFRLDAAATFATFNTSVGDFDATALSIGGEYKFSGSAFSLYGGYTNLDTDIDDATADVVTLGVRVNWDEDLLARDRRGASLLRVGDFASLF